MCFADIHYRTALGEQAVDRLADETDDLDATILPFASDYDLGGIRAKERGHGHRWYWLGE